jgi:PAS domain S-box-containing protein
LLSLQKLGIISFIYSLKEHGYMSLWLPEDDILSRHPEELKQALDRYRRVLDGSGYAFWEWGLRDNSYSCGGNFWAKLGYFTVEEAVTCVENVQEYVHPDDFTMVYEVVLSHLRHNTPIDMVYRIKAKDGTYWWTQACASSTRNEEGRVTFISGVNFDLSHLKDTEKALRLSEARHERILAASNDGIWEWSIGSHVNDGRFHTSHSCWRHLGYTEEEVDSLPENERLAIWRSHIHPDDLVKMQRALKRHFILKKPFDMEYRMFGHEGEMFWMRSRGQAIFNGRGRAILMSGINVDVTKVKEAEERVRKAKEDAEKANNAKSHFLSSMSHELRTPLNAIMGFSQLSMHDEGLSLQQKGHAQQVYNAGEHLLDLINDVLDLAQIEAGKVSLLIEPVSPYRIIQECMSLLASVADQRSIQLSFHGEHYKDDCVLADSKRLKQCLLNLMSNAVKYNINNGEVNIVLAKDNGCLVISVGDTGHGIPRHKRGELFQPFNRLGAEHGRVDGSGIGLVITKELVEKMRGEIHYCDVSAKGACFKVSLPMAMAHAAVVPLLGNVNMSPQKVELADFRSNKRVLYIEDNASNIHLMSQLLAPYPQLTLCCYSDPLLGLYSARTDMPDMIILDINLPNISGVELVSLLKGDAMTQHIPVIALSANAMAYDVDKGLRAGFDEYLTKPIDMQRLVAVLNQQLSDIAV